MNTEGPQSLFVFLLSVYRSKIINVWLYMFVPLGLGGQGVYTPHLDDYSSDLLRGYGVVLLTPATVVTGR